MRFPSSIIGVFLTVLGLSVSGCGKNSPPDAGDQSAIPSDKNPNAADPQRLQQVGDADASLAYWNSFNTQRPDWTDIREASEAWSLGTVNEDVQFIRTDGVWAFIIQSLIERNEGLSQLPMKDADPAMLAFTAEIATFNGLRIEILGEAPTNPMGSGRFLWINS